MGSALAATMRRETMSTPSRDFEAMYREYVPVILRYLHRRLGSSAAEDATTEVFLRAFNGRWCYRPTHETPLPWLYGIAARVIADYRRAERRRIRAIERFAREAERRPPETPSVDESLSVGLAGALSKLAERDRETVLLYAWGELSYAEIATALDIPVGTVRSRLARIRKQMSGVLEPLEIDRRPEMLEEAP